MDFANNPDSEQDHLYVYCSNLAYTYSEFSNLKYFFLPSIDIFFLDKFQNEGHLDNDVSTFTHGIGGNVIASAGTIASFGNGYSMSGGFFYIADYTILFNYE